MHTCIRREGYLLLAKIACCHFNWMLQGESEEVWTNAAIYSHALLRISVIRGQRSVRIAPPSLPPHQSGPATQDSSGCAGPVLCHGPALWSPPSGSVGDIFLWHIEWAQTYVIGQSRKALRIYFEPRYVIQEITENAYMLHVVCTTYHPWLRPIIGQSSPNIPQTPI